ncbi:MAG: dihydrodipicolinate synthase family protein [Rugosibacter sp.]
MEFTRKEAKQWALKNVRGLYMCPLTPVTPDFKFDEAGIRENIEKYVDMGIDGLVVGGFISECWNVKPAEWNRYHEVVADATKGRMDLWTIILDPEACVAVEKMNFVEKLGYNGAEVINPVVQLRADDEIFDWFKYVTDRSDLAVCLYRTPVSGKVMGLDLMNRLADIDTVIGAKQGELNRAVTLRMRRTMRPDFIVMEPSEYWLLDEQRVGGQVLWGELSYMLYGKKRHLVKDYVRLSAEGKHEEARKAWLGLEGVRTYYEEEFLWTIAATATYAGALGTLKAWYEAIGLKSGPVIPPVRSPSRERFEQVAAKLRELGVA